MSQNTRKCKTCSTEYEYCPNCGQYATLPSYMNMFCSENCKDLFMLASNFAAKEFDKEEAKKHLSKLDLSKLNKEGFSNSVRKIVNEINGVDKKEEKSDVKPAQNNKHNNQGKTVTISK